MVQMLGVPDHQIDIIGTRHGEKLFETLLSREEMAGAMDLGDYYRILPDLRDLNYAKYVDVGEARIAEVAEYNSHNTRRLDLPAMKSLLGSLDYMQDILAQRGVAR